MNLIILGPPGSGKGTQSDILVKKYHLIHLSTGDLLRDEITKKSEIGLLAKNYMNQGKYVPDDIINNIVANKINEIKNNFILDGYPRTMIQVKFLENVLKKINYKIDLVLYLDINEKTIINRLLTRLICPLCKTTYNKVTLPPKVDNICDKDKTPLIQRTDDNNKEKIIVRLNEYNVSTQPLVDYFKKQGILKVIDANQNSNIVNQKLIQIMEKTND